MSPAVINSSAENENTIVTHGYTSALLYYGRREDRSTQAMDTHPIHKIYSIAHPRSQHLILLLELLHYEAVTLPLLEK